MNKRLKGMSTERSKGRSRETEIEKWTAMGIQRISSKKTEKGTRREMGTERSRRKEILVLEI